MHMLLTVVLLHNYQTTPVLIHQATIFAVFIEAGTQIYVKNKV